MGVSRVYAVNVGAFVNKFASTNSDLVYSNIQANDQDEEEIQNV